MKYAADPLFKAECLGYRAACSSIKQLEMANRHVKQKEIRSLSKEQEIGTVTHDCLHCRGIRGTRDGAGGRTQKRDGRTAASGAAGRYAVAEGHICAMQRI